MLKKIYIIFNWKASIPVICMKESEKKPACNKCRSLYKDTIKSILKHILSGLYGTVWTAYWGAFCHTQTPFQNKNKAWLISSRVSLSLFTLKRPLYNKVLIWRLRPLHDCISNNKPEIAQFTSLRCSGFGLILNCWEPLGRGCLFTGPAHVFSITMAQGLRTVTVPDSRLKEMSEHAKTMTKHPMKLRYNFTTDHLYLEF